MAQTLKFIKTATVGTSGLTAGAVYFETSTGLIKVAKSTSEVDVFGGNLKDFSFENSKLTLTKADDSKVVLDFTDVPSAEGVQSLISDLRKDVNAAKQDAADLQSATGIEDGATAISIEGLNATDVVSALEELYGLVDAAAQGGVLSLNGATGNLVTIGVKDDKTVGNVVLTLDETALAAAIADAKKAGEDAQDTADKAVEDAATADAKAVEAQTAAEAAQADATQALTDAAAAQAQADKGVEDAAAAMAEAEKKVDKVEGSRLMTNAEGTKLEGISEGANKVEASEQNGYIKIDGTETKVYELPAQTDYTVTVTTPEDNTVAAKYVFSQCGSTIATINIPKDLVVKSGSVVEHNGKTCIELVLQNDEANPIYIDVADLIEYVTSGSAAGDMVVVNVSDDHKVTATITDGTITLAKLHDDLKALINKAHSHDNKAVLDGISADQVESWDEAAAAMHSHANKALLDTYAQTEEDLADAVAKKHSHDNAEELAKVATGDVAKWNAKQDAIADLEDIRSGAALGATSVQDVKIGNVSIVADAVASFSFAAAVDGNVNLSMDANKVVSAELTWATFE